MPKHVLCIARKIFTREKYPEQITGIHEVHILPHNIIKNLTDVEKSTVTTTSVKCDAHCPLDFRSSCICREMTEVMRKLIIYRTI